MQLLCQSIAFIYLINILFLDICGSNADCVDNAGSYTCTCHEGYTSTSNTGGCINIDECTTGVHQCQHQCVDNEGSYSCACNSGYTLSSDGTRCVDENECAGNNDCAHTCINTNGAYRCSCNPGYALDNGK